MSVLHANTCCIVSRPHYERTCFSDLATHLDGYIATVAGTTVVGATDNAPVSGRAADVIAAAYTGAEAMLRLVKAEGTVRGTTRIAALVRGNTDWS